MFHQMHYHCLSLACQAVLCARDTTPNPLHVNNDGKLIGTDGIGVAQVRRDWKVFVRANHLSSVWNSSI
ncbi:hypothetical protein BV22DRAFT_1031896 [Leucogyrophana mollusca]|uniref:Uncharacterized protein n=1 Tax=Leucogyrophana mollusca TaxID=85980 RepID=A0ACB8BP38_9AGAM|nr:hypothetical protein BV22DRAFT_1031896 [Leucogyrophana mollusca]